MQKLVSLFFLLCQVTWILGSPTNGSVSRPLPRVTLPWGTWTAYREYEDVIRFKNIRFAKSPTGELRFKQPQYPDPIPSPDKALMSNDASICYQVQVRQPSCAVPKPKEQGGEDCLFLDVYVPRSVWENARSGKKNTPVVVWFYGGAYQFGAKSTFEDDVPLYHGDGLIAAARRQKSDMIFVAGNYRLGAFGWLAETSMEKHATPNAGLYDQRLVLRWVQDYIGLFGGDKNQVSAWGESAGGSSIMHHLVAREGKQDPLFRRAFVQSPGYLWKWDRNGTMEQTFQDFAKLSNCKDGDFGCLQKAKAQDLAAANQQLFDKYWKNGIFPTGPSLDGSLIKELPPVAFKEGRFWKSLTSLAVSHVTREAPNYTPPGVETEQDFKKFLENLFPEASLSNVRDAIRRQYPAGDSKSKEAQQARLEKLVADVGFICNTRQLYDAYAGAPTSLPVYMMHYDFLGQRAIHASDLLPTFSTPKFDIYNFLRRHLCLGPGEAYAAAFSVKNIAPRFQAYLADLGTHGNPNHHRKLFVWRPARVNKDGKLGSVFRITGKFGVFRQSTDEQNTRDICEFWNKAARNITMRKMDEGSLLRNTFSYGAEVDEQQIMLEL